jgi:hypothetical protein
MLLKMLSFILTAALLSACTVGPTRLDTKSFTLLQEGRVPPKSSMVFTDCLMDGFSNSHTIATNITARQHRRSDLYRVEAFVDATILVSADVFDDGRVQLLESTSTFLINVTGEKDAFAKCLKQYGVAQP